MLKCFTSGNRLFARLLGFSFLLSLLQNGSTAVSQNKQKDDLNSLKFNRNKSAKFQSTRIFTNSEYKQQVKRSSPTDKRITHLIKDLSEEPKFRFVDQFSSILSEISTDSPSLNEPGLHVNKIDGLYHITLDANVIHLTETNRLLQKIERLYFFNSIIDLKLMNLPIEQSDALIIGSIFRKQSNISKLSWINCTISENVEKEKFYKSFSLLSLDHLEIRDCNGIEGILIYSQKFFTTLILDSNKKYWDFTRLTQLLRGAQDLQSLTLDYNEIRTEGFDIFFQFISQLPNLKKLSLINHYVINSFLKLLKWNEFNTPLESLILSCNSDNIYTRNIGTLSKLESLKYLELPFDVFLDHKVGSFINYLTNQTCLKTISIQKKRITSPLKLNFPPSGSDIVLDLSGIRYHFYKQLNISQMKRVTNLFIDNHFNFKTILSIENPDCLYELRKVTWNSDQVYFFPMIMSKCLSIDSLYTSSNVFNQLNCQQLLTDKILLMDLKLLQINFHVKSTIENQCIIHFILSHYWIKTLNIYALSFDFIEQFSEKILERRITFSNLQLLKVAQLKGENIFAFYNCLKSMPNIKEVRVHYSSSCEEIVNPGFNNWVKDCEERKKEFYNDDKTYLEEERPFSPVHLVPLPIEKLFLIPNVFGSSCVGLLSLLFPNVPLLRTLYLSKFSIFDMKIAIDSLKMFPNLRHLRLIDCLVNELIIENLINEIKRLKWFSFLEVRSRLGQDDLYKPLVALKLPFLMRVNLNWSNE